MSVPRLTEILERSFDSDDLLTTRNYLKYFPKSFIPMQQVKEQTTVAIKTVKGSYTINVADATGIIAGRYIILFNSLLGNAYYGFVKSVSENEITMNAQINDEYPIGSPVDSTNIYLNVNGAVTPVEFIRRGTGTNLTSDLIITKLHFAMSCNSAVDLIKFGDLTALTNGVVIREKNTVEKHLLSVRSNSEMRLLFNEFEIYTATNPAQGLHGLFGCVDFVKIDSAIRLNPTSDLSVMIQDDLSGLINFVIVPEGYFVS